MLGDVVAQCGHGIVEGEKRLRAFRHGRLRDFDGSDNGDKGSSMGCIDDSQYGNWEASGHGNAVSRMKDWSMEM